MDGKRNTTTGKTIRLVSRFFSSFGVLSFFFVLFLIQFLSLSIWFAPTALAQLTEAEGATVRATVPIWDTTPPSIPILISPANNSILNTAKPSFVWQKSTDAFGESYPSYGIVSYDFFQDGSSKYGNLPLNSSETVNYSLVYNSGTGRYSLTPKTNFSEGNHTWKIQVKDYFGNVAESVTWSFRVDTNAPNFVLESIGAIDTSISAQDPSTIPDAPIILEDNRPLLVAVGEANSTIELTVEIPSEPDQNYTQSISSEGNWEFELPLLPRDEIVLLTFIITDQAGNVSILEDVPFLIETQVIIITPVLPTPTPTPTAAPTPTPTPEDPDEESTASATPEPPTLPSPSPSVPSIVIPVLPPEEIVDIVADEITTRIPQALLDLTQAVPEIIKAPVRAAAPYGGIIVASFTPALAAAAVASQFGGGLSLTIFARIMQALGLLPKGAPQGMVFDSQNHEPVPFALLTIKSVASQATQAAPVSAAAVKDWIPDVVETVVTDAEGIYSGISLPVGSYTIQVSHQDYRSPTQTPRPAYLAMEDYYKGEIFEIKTSEIKNKTMFLIPVDAISPEAQKHARKNFKFILARLTRLGSSITLPLFIISGIMAIIVPSIWNIGVFSCYALLVAYRAVGWFKNPRISGVVVTSDGDPQPDTLIRISKPNSNQLVALLRTNHKGEFSYFGPAERYIVSIYKPGFIWLSDSQSPLSLFEINTTEEPGYILATLHPQSDVYQDLFGDAPAS